MAARSLTERVAILEEKVGTLQELPPRMATVESQISQLRGEVSDGFSAIRREMHALRDEVLTRVQEGDEETRRHARVLHEELLTRLSLLQEVAGSADHGLAG